MKSLKQILSKVSLNEDWQYGVDFSTGDTIKYWVSQEAKSLPKDAIEWLEEDPDEYYKKIEQEKKLQKKLEKWEDKYDSLDDELKDNKRQLKELRIDMEEELGHLYSDGKEDRAEEKAQEYGQEIENLEVEIFRIKKEMDNCQKQIEAISEEILYIWD